MVPSPHVETCSHLDRCDSADGGGGREYARHLSSELGRNPRRFDITILYSEESGDEQCVEGFDSRAILLPSGPRMLRVLSRVVHQELVLPIRLRGFDLLYAPADIGPRFRSVPAVVMVQNLHLYDTRFYDNPRLRLLRRRARQTLSRADRIVFPSDAAAAIVTRSLPLPPERCVVAHHELTWSQAATRTPIDDVRPYLFLPCALERHKNIEVLIRSIPHLPDPGLEVRIAGPSDSDRPYAKGLQKLAEELGVGVLSER